jgi:hypothetical protein
VCFLSVRKNISYKIAIFVKNLSKMSFLVLLRSETDNTVHRKGQVFELVQKHAPFGLYEKFSF